ncbi:MIP/aquaporin family protein [Labedella populi]|nr:MIP/aquaporin family protein [Labedella populi]
MALNMDHSLPDPTPARPHLARRFVAEFLGTGLLVTIVVGSGIAAAELSPDDVGLQLLENSLATALGLAVLILMFGPVSGAHFNPVVTLVDWVIGARSDTGLPLRDVAPYIVAQVLGGSAGAVLANVMFDVPWQLASTDRATGGHLVAEVVATAGLVLLVFSLARTASGSVTAAAVGAYIGAAYWFTSSTSFANPAVTVGRVFSDTFAGIAPGSVPPFILMQLLGGVVGLALVLVLYPTAARAADDVVVPHSVDAKL